MGVTRDNVTLRSLWDIQLEMSSMLGARDVPLRSPV